MPAQPEDSLELSFAEVLIRVRTKKGMTQETLAECSGLSVRTISGLERGRIGRPRRRSVELLGTALGLSDKPLAAFLRAAGADDADPWASEPLAAFLRAIDTDDAPDNADLPGGATRCTLPPPAALFTGRDGELAALRRIATDDPGLMSGPVLVTVTGQPGVGKSALAVAAGYELAEHFPDGQLFITLQGTDTTPVTPATALSRLLAALGVAAIPTDTEERTALYRSLLHDRRMLLILDNAIDEAQVRPLLPTGGNLALVTSRRRLSGLPATERLFLDILPHHDAAAMVERILGPQRCAAEPHAVHDLVTGCGRLPLALRIAANRLASRPDWSVRQLVERLGDEHRRLNQLRAGDLTVRGPFEVSYHQLNQPSAVLFRRLALIDGPDFDPTLAAALGELDSATAEDTLDELVEASLVEPAASGRYRLHDLIKLFAADTLTLLDPPEVQAAAQERLVDFLLDTAIRAGSYFQLDEHITARLRHARAGRPLRSRAEANAWLGAEAANWLGALHRAAALGRHRQVVDLGRAIDEFSKINALNDTWPDIWPQVFRLTTDSARAAGLHEQEIAQRNSLGWALDQCAGRIIDGLRENEAALALAEQIGDRRGQAWSLMHMGMKHAFGGADAGLDRAVANCRTAVALIDTVDDPIGAMMARHYLGCVLYRQGAYAEAETLLREAEQQFLAREQHDGPGGAMSAGLAVTQLWRARNLLRLGSPTQAVAVADEAADRYAALGATISQGMAHTCAARAMAELGDLEGALRRLDRVIALYTGCADRGSEVDALLTAAELHDRAGQPERARAHRIRALHLAEQVGGDRGNRLRERARTALS